jgi:hypothetical protein
MDIVGITRGSTLTPNAFRLPEIFYPVAGLATV